MSWTSSVALVSVGTDLSPIRGTAAPLIKGSSNMGLIQWMMHCVLDEGTCRDPLSIFKCNELRVSGVKCVL